MIIDEYVFYSVIGRSGSTFLRNQISKYDECLCLVTGEQVKLLEQNIDNNTLSFKNINKLLKYDIKKLFSDNKVDDEKIRFFLYKMPLFAMLESQPRDNFKRVRPIFIVRNPLLSVLSASKSSFLPNPEKLNLLFESIQRAYTKLGIEVSKEHQEDKKKYDGDIIMSNAVIFKMSFELHKYYFNTIYKKEFLLFSFEDFLSEPTKSMKALLKYTNMFYDDAYIEAKLNQNFYNDIVEEGGILMSKNLDKKSINTNKEFTQELESYLKKELDYLSYSADNVTYPKTKLIDRL